MACRTFRGAPDASPGGGLQDAGVKKDSDFNRASLSVVGSVVRSSVDFRPQWAASRACRRISARVPTPGWARVVRRAGAGASKLAYCPGTLDVRFPRKQWRDRVRQQSLDPSRSLSINSHPPPQRRAFSTPPTPPLEESLRVVDRRVEGREPRFTKTCLKAKRCSRPLRCDADAPCSDGKDQHDLSGQHSGRHDALPQIEFGHRPSRRPARNRQALIVARA